MHLKALTGDFALNTVCGFKHLLFFLSFQSCNKEKLTGGCHFYLNGIEKVYILFYKPLYPAVFLCFKPNGQIGFVIVKSFGRIGANYLNIRQS